MDTREILHESFLTVEDIKERGVRGQTCAGGGKTNSAGRRVVFEEKQIVSFGEIAENVAASLEVVNRARMVRRALQWHIARPRDIDSIVYDAGQSAAHPQRTAARATDKAWREYTFPARKAMLLSRGGRVLVDNPQIVDYPSDILWLPADAQRESDDTWNARIAYLKARRNLAQRNAARGLSAIDTAHATTSDCNADALDARMIAKPSAPRPGGRNPRAAQRAAQRAAIRERNAREYARIAQRAAAKRAAESDALQEEHDRILVEYIDAMRAIADDENNPQRVDGSTASRAIGVQRKLDRAAQAALELDILDTLRNGTRWTIEEYAYRQRVLRSKESTALEKLVARLFIREYGKMNGIKPAAIKSAVHGLRW